MQSFSFNRILLLVIGLWPYQRTKFTRFQCICCFTILTSSIIFQLTRLITSKCTANLICEVFSSVSFFIVSLAKYNSFCINTGAIKDILIQLEHVRNQLKDKNEVAIIDEYTYNARQYSIGLTILCAFFTFVFITLQYFPSILIFPVLSKNVSQSRHVPIKMEYFIDQEKYFNLILLHVNVTFCIALVSILSIGTMLITYFIFTCGMFKITCYRIKRALNCNIQRNVTTKRKNLIVEDIKYAVEIHLQAMKLTTHIMSIFETMIFLLIVFGVICLALNLFELFEMMSSEINMEKFILPVVNVAISIIYMFISNYIGQNIIDHNNDVFHTA
ncbi:hypothetical protein PUN28_014516 [Cardiocondyla obscurior]|uniref:Odorant receptor n=1 Tax=Cardiocondyla obscurior TaxID=286306 RepID=A0AAW2F5K4_9HYME